MNHTVVSGRRSKAKRRTIGFAGEGIRSEVQRVRQVVGLSLEAYHHFRVLKYQGPSLTMEERTLKRTTKHG